MSERLTVVFDDTNLYRRLKIAAAESHVPMKRVVEDAIRAYLGPETPAAAPLDWDAYDRWQEEVAELNQDLEAAEAASRVINLPVRYDREDEHERPTMIRSMAEEPTPYETD
jgi:hypothetical protein